MQTYEGSCLVEVLAETLGKKKKLHWPQEPDFSSNELGAVSGQRNLVGLRGCGVSTVEEMAYEPER